MGSLYEVWRDSPEGQQAIKRSMDKAKAQMAAFIARKKADEDRAYNKWCRDSLERATANSLPQSLGPNGRIDDNYTASDFPLDIGWIANSNGPELVYVALGGVNVINYLPPAALADIRSHIDCCFDDEIGRTA